MSKSRSGKTPSTNQNAPPGPAQNAIIPGKFYESDWLELIEIEEDENFIADIIDEITDSVLDQVHAKIIKSRVLPHTVLSTRSLLLDILDWQFLQSDPGELKTGEHVSWLEDVEPVTCTINNWAQGAVPVDARTESYAENSPVGICESSESSLETTSAEDRVTEVMENLQISENEDDNEINMVEVNLKMTELEVSSNSENGEKSLSEHVSNNSQAKSPNHVKQKAKKYRPHVGKLADFENISLHSVTDLRPKPGTRPLSGSQSFQKFSEFKVKKHYGRASGPKEVVYDEKGKVLKVEKLNVANFPSHRVPVKYSIVDADAEKSTEKKRQKCKNKINNSEKTKTLNQISATTLLKKMHSSTTWNKSLMFDGNGNEIGYPSLEPRSPLPPLMVDSINVADGVIVREGGLSKQVLKKKSLVENSVGKSPVFPINNSANRVLEVKDIVSETSPSFRFITT